MRRLAAQMRFHASRLLWALRERLAPCWCAALSWLVVLVLRLACWAGAWSGYSFRWRPHGALGVVTIYRNRGPRGSCGGAIKADDGGGGGELPLTWSK